MFITRARFLGSFFLIVFTALSPRISDSQSVGPPSFLNASEMACGQERRRISPADSEDDRWQPSSEHEIGPAVQDCAGTLSASGAPDVSRESLFGHRHSDMRPANLPKTPRLGAIPNHFAVDPSIATADPSLAIAREAALEILSADSPCSRWFRQFDPEVVTTFRSLNFQIDQRGPDYAIQERANGALIEHGPYSARTTEDTGPGTIVILNANGPFFHSRINLYILNLPGGVPVYTGHHMFTHVGPYDGGSLRAQIIILLHELAHVIGGIPEDDSSRFGFARSRANTATVLQYCRPATDGFLKYNAVILTPAVAGVPGIQ